MRLEAEEYMMPNDLNHNELLFGAMPMTIF